MVLDLDRAHNALSEAVIASAIEVHSVLGPGLLESVYEHALSHELSERRVPHIRQAVVPFTYKGLPVGEGRLDLLVDRRVVVELKAVEHLLPVHNAQLLSYLRLADLRLGLLINFNVPSLHRGLKRLINSPRPSASSAPPR